MPPSAFLEGLAATLPEPPKALLVDQRTLGGAGLYRQCRCRRPQLIFDYSGFPEHTYRLTWPAPGDPALAARAADLLEQAGLPAAVESAAAATTTASLCPSRWRSLKAQIPVVTLSLAAVQRVV